MEDMLSIQMKKQIIKMTNETAKKSDVVVALQKSGKGNGRRQVVKYCEINGDGDCLFLSLSHKLFASKVDSDEHMNDALQLRARVVEFILSNISEFLHVIKGRIYESESNSDAASKSIDEDECRNFVQNKLAKPGFWGGIETFKAVSLIHNVNIVCLNDDGSYNLPCKFNSKAERSLIILYSQKVHYDSVVGFSDLKLSNIVDVLVSDQKKSVKLDMLDVSHISIS